MSLRQKILLLSFMAITGMFLTIWLQYGNFIIQTRAVERVSANVQTVSALSGAVHELQKERGQAVTGQYQNLDRQFRHTDAALDTLEKTPVPLPGFRERLDAVRHSTLQQSAGFADIRLEYTQLLRQLLDAMDTLTHEPRLTIAASDIDAHRHLIEAKEYLGQLRATLGQILESEQPEPVALRTLFSLKGLYDEQVRRLRGKASAELSHAFEDKCRDQANERMFQALEHIMAHGVVPTSLTTMGWWTTSSMVINNMKSLEELSLEIIRQHTHEELSQLQSSMHVGMAVVSVAALAVLFLTISATTSLLRALSAVLSSIDRIVRNQDFSSRIPTRGPNEITHIATTFNTLLSLAEALIQEKETLAITDPLTGISNRLQFTRVLDDEAARKRRNSTPMALIMFDIDHFKRVNDTWGHNTGDAVLKEIARIVSAGIRASDVFARWGGEEFVLLLRDNDCKAARIVAEKLRQQIEWHPFPIIGNLTCSFGVTAWQPDDDEAGFLARADKALYASKAAGRNQVSCEKHGRLDCSSDGLC